MKKSTAALPTVALGVADDARRDVGVEMQVDHVDVRVGEQRRRFVQ